MTESQTQYSVMSEASLITNEMIAILSDPANCLASLGGKDAATTNAGSILNMVQKAQPRFQVNNAYGNGKIKINSYSLTASDPDVGLATNTTMLHINFNRKATQPGAGDIVKKIKLYVEVDGTNKITLCRSLSTASTDIWSRGSGGDIYYAGGRVGIETASPTSTLQVAGGIRAAKGDTSASNASQTGFSFEEDGDTGMFAEGGSAHTGSDLILKADGQAGITIKNGKYYGTPECFTVNGPAGLGGSTATCPAGTIMTSGGAFCDNGNVAYIHSSMPSGNGWTADCYGRDGNDHNVTAVAYCCKVAP